MTIIKFEGRWLPPADQFKKVCIEISKDLSNFKRNSIYSGFIGNDLRNKVTAIAFYEHIRGNYPYLLEKNLLNNFLINDRIGAPYIYNIDGVKISPGTLRFMRVLGDILNIDDEIKNIVEIGSGYGGQALIIKSYLTMVDYNLIDIPESMMVARSYLRENNCNVTFMDINNINSDNYYDLVISDYCLSELDLDGIGFYIKNIIEKCKYGYFTVNSISDSVLFKELTEQLNSIFNDVSITEEVPKTSHHSNHIFICKDNKILK